MANAAIEQTFEFDESELYNDEASPEHLVDDMSEEEPVAKLADDALSSESDSEPEFDKLSVNDEGDSESAKSASLQVSMPDLDSHEHSPPDHFSKGMLGSTYTKAIYNPRPVPSTRLGTSAPIAIPHMSRWKLSATTEGGEPANVPQTFIPPHQLSQKDDFMFSFTGASPSAVIKRDRLRQRNAILRSTGFLEKHAQPSTLPQQEPQRTAQSSLTAALSTIGEC